MEKYYLLLRRTNNRGKLFNHSRRDSKKKKTTWLQHNWKAAKSINLRTRTLEQGLGWDARLGAPKKNTSQPLRGSVPGSQGPTPSCSSGKFKGLTPRNGTSFQLAPTQKGSQPCPRPIIENPKPSKAKLP